MILKELIEKTSFEEIWTIYSEKQEVQEKEEEVFRYIYETLKNKTPKSVEDPLTIVLKTEKRSYEENGQEETHEILLTVGKDENGKTYDLTMTDWDEILGYEVGLGHYEPGEFIGHVFYEISFYGTEDMMNEKREELVRRIETPGTPLSGEALYEAAMKILEERLKNEE